jgi:hypothetical protein
MTGNHLRLDHQSARPHSTSAGTSTGTESPSPAPGSFTIPPPVTPAWSDLNAPMYSSNEALSSAASTTGSDGVNCESLVVLDAHFQAIADSTLAIDANTTWSRSQAVSIVGPVAL